MTKKPISSEATRDDLISMIHSRDAVISDLKGACVVVDELMEAMRDLVTILDGAQSGFMSGSGSDIDWKKGRDRRVAAARSLIDAVGK